MYISIYMYVHMYLHVHVHVPVPTVVYTVLFLRSARLSSHFNFNSRSLRSGGVSFELRVVNGEERSVV